MPQISIYSAPLARREQAGQDFSRGFEHGLELRFIDLLNVFGHMADDFL
jgi:hypothetical protein